MEAGLREEQPTPPPADSPQRHNSALSNAGSSSGAGASPFQQTQRPPLAVESFSSGFYAGLEEAARYMEGRGVTASEFYGQAIRKLRIPGLVVL